MPCGPIGDQGLFIGIGTVVNVATVLVSWYSAY